MGKGTIRGRIELAIYPWSVKTDGSYEKFRAGNCNRKGRREKVLDSIGTLKQTVNEFQI